MNLTQNDVYAHSPSFLLILSLAVNSEASKISFKRLAGAPPLSIMVSDRRSTLVHITRKLVTNDLYTFLYVYLSMAKKPGRPSSDEISTESVRQANDASKIDVQTEDSETARLLKEANAILTQSAKTDLLKAAATNAKKAALEAKREAEEEYADMRNKTNPPTNTGFRSLPAGITPADIREIASALPEDQREAFIRQSLGMSSGNGLMNAFMQRTPTAQPAATTQTATQQPMSFVDMMQGMMGLMTMSMQLEQKKSDEWRQQQQYLEEQHRRHVEELREARGEVRDPGPDPMAEAYKLQIEMLRNELESNRAMIKELVEAKKSGGDSSGALEAKILELTQKNLDIQNQALETKVKSMEAQLQQNSRFQMNINDIIKQAKDAGANLHVGDSTDLQIANDHEYRMEQLRLAREREDKIAEAQIEASKAKQAQAQSQQELIKTLAVAVGKELFSGREAKDVKSSSESVKKLAGAVQ